MSASIASLRLASSHAVALSHINAGVVPLGAELHPKGWRCKPKLRRDKDPKNTMASVNVGKENSGWCHGADGFWKTDKYSLDIQHYLHISVFSLRIRAIGNLTDHKPPCKALPRAAYAPSPLWSANLAGCPRHARQKSSPLATLTTSQGWSLIVTLILIFTTRLS